MQQIQSLPKINELRRFAYTIPNFPITGLGILQVAERTETKSVTDFLELFSGRVIFFNRGQFLHICRLLLRMIRESSSSSDETVMEED